MRDNTVVGEEGDKRQQRQDADENDERRNERREDRYGSRFVVVDQRVIRRHCSNQHSVCVLLFCW